jgi:hypothetical protein
MEYIYVYNIRMSVGRGKVTYCYSYSRVCQITAPLNSIPEYCEEQNM